LRAKLIRCWQIFCAPGASWPMKSDIDVRPGISGPVGLAGVQGAGAALFNYFR
jgi:hypothetical protein